MGDEKLFLIAYSSVSQREAHIAEEVDSVWLYLTQRGSKRIQNDSWLLNTPDAPPEPTEQAYRSVSAPPPLPARMVREGGVRDVPDATRWRLVWSEDGEAVAALLDQEPIGFVRSGSRRGRALYIQAGGESWAETWSDSEFARLFPEHSETEG